MQGPKNHANLRVDLFHRVLGVALNRTFGSSLVLRMCLLILLSLGVFAYGGYRLVVERVHCLHAALQRIQCLVIRCHRYSRASSVLACASTSARSRRLWIWNDARSMVPVNANGPS